jgi:hypothetical protein
LPYRLFSRTSIKSGLDQVFHITKSRKSASAAVVEVGNEFSTALFLLHVTVENSCSANAGESPQFFQFFHKSCELARKPSIGVAIAVFVTLHLSCTIGLWRGRKLLQNKNIKFGQKG